MKPKSIKVIGWTVGMGLGGFILGSKQSYALDWHDLLIDKPVLMGTGVGVLAGLALGIAFSRKQQNTDTSHPDKSK